MSIQFYVRRATGKILWGAIVSAGLISSGQAQNSWSAPVMIHDSWFDSDPTLAVSTSGTLVAAWVHSRTYTNPLSGPFFNYPVTKRSHIYVAYSRDRGLSWSQPQSLSDPGEINEQVDVSAGNAGDLHFTWSGGDALSGYRLHTRSTFDDGVSYTSATKIQDLADPGQGFLQPDIQSGEERNVVSWTAAKQNLAGRPFRAFAATQEFAASDWQSTTEFESPLSANDNFVAQGDMAADGLNFIISGSVAAPNSVSSRPAFVKSSDGGLTWSPPRLLTFSLYAQKPSIAYDGNGTWLAMYIGYGSATDIHGQLYVQKSHDAGDTWTEPQIAATPLRLIDTYVSIAGDGRGRWLAFCNSGNIAAYTWSSDNGQFWNDRFAPLPFSAPNWRDVQCFYAGNNQWSIIGNAYATVYAYMEWGPSFVGNWELY